MELKVIKRLTKGKLYSLGILEPPDPSVPCEIIGYRRVGPVSSEDRQAWVPDGSQVVFLKWEQADMYNPSYWLQAIWKDMILWFPSNRVVLWKDRKKE